MTRSLTEGRAFRHALWGFPLVIVGVSWAIPSAAVALVQDAPAKQASEQVDPATKKLTAAHGLFQRSLFKLAATQYTEFLKQYPGHPDATTAKYALAVCRYRLAEFEPAINAITEVLADAKFAQRDEALAVLGHSQLAGNNYEKALVAFEELLAKYPDSKHAETAALNRAQVLYLAGHKPEALKAGQAFLTKYPQSVEKPTAQYFLALAQRDQKQNKEAAETLKALLAGTPQSRFGVDAMLLLGQCLEATGDLDGAAAQYVKMIAAAPQSRKADGQFSLGTLQYKTGKYDASIESLSAMLKDAPASPYANAARLQLGLAQLATGKIDRARGTLIEIIDENKGHANEANYGLAQCDIAEKKFAEARIKLDKLIAANPAPANLAQVKLDRAVCLTELNQHEPAAAEFAAFVAAYPDSPQVPEALYRQAFSLHKLGKFDLSHALAEKLAKLPASDFTAPTAELDAENLFLLGKYAEAEKAFTALAASAKDDDRKLQYAFRTGQAAYFQAKYPEAATLLAPLAENPKVATTEPYHPAVFLLGDALLQQGKNAEAIVALKRFVEIAKGDKLEARFKLGLAQLRADKKDDAEHTFAQLEQGPESQWTQRAQFEYGQMLYKAGKGDRAAQSLARVVAAPKAPEEIVAPSVYLLGWVDFDAKKYPEAAAKWAQLIERYPKHALTADATYQRGVALSEAKQYEPALASLTAYSKDNPKGEHVAQAQRLAAAALTALNRNDEAAAMLAQLAGDASSASDAVLYDLAWSHRTKKDNVSAAAAYQTLLKKFPDSKLAPAAKAELAEFLYNDKQYDQAVTLLEAVAAAPEKAEPKTLAAAQYRLGWCYDKLKQPEKAAAAFTAFAEKNPKDELSASALLQGGLCYASVGELPKAQASLKKVLADFPNYAQANVAMLKLGQIQSDAMDYDASLATLNQYLRQFPNDAFVYQAHFGVGWAQENKKQFSAARDSYQKVIAAHNGETAARAQFQIGESYLAEGKFEEAIPALLAVEDVYAYPTWGAKALLESGRAFEELKQADQAKMQYASVVEKYKDLPEAKLAAERLAALKSSAAAAQ